ncbi:MAG: hypothetical protein AAFV53_41960 [Myxococcota bacterium]
MTRCVSRSPSFDGTGYELIDVYSGEAWISRDWTEAEYADFSLPWSWMTWLKNEPRDRRSEGAEFIRSPGCSEDGQHSYMVAFGKEFVHVGTLNRHITGVDVNPEEAQAYGSVGGITKYHRLTFQAGQTIHILHSPSGERFVNVNRIAGHTVAPTLQDGWTITAHPVRRPTDVTLFGDVYVLRLDNGSSYQAPFDIIPEL